MTRPILETAWSHPLLDREFMLEEFNRKLTRGSFRQGIYDGWGRVSERPGTYAGGFAGTALQIARTVLDDAELLPTKVAAFPSLFGIPSGLAYLANSLFEKMPKPYCGNFAVQFYSQIAQDADLRNVANGAAVRIIREVIVQNLEERGLFQFMEPLEALASGIRNSWGVASGSVTSTPQTVTDEVIAIADAISPTLEKAAGKQLKDGARYLAYGIRRGLYTDDTSAFSSLGYAAMSLAGVEDKAQMIAVRVAAIICDECSRAPAPENTEVPSMVLHP
jgi:hypothetical protein